MPQYLTTWDGRLSFLSKKVVLRILIALKNPSSSAGFEPVNLGSNGKHDNHQTTESDFHILSEHKVNGSPTTRLWRRREGEISSYSFSTSALARGEWSASLPGRVLPQVPIVQEAGWPPEPVWTHRLEEKYLASAEDRTSIARSSSTNTEVYKR
jgi:hypothetical protein